MSSDGSWPQPAVHRSREWSLYSHNPKLVRARSGFKQISAYVVPDRGRGADATYDAPRTIFFSHTNKRLESAVMSWRSNRRTPHRTPCATVSLPRGCARQADGEERREQHADTGPKSETPAQGIDEQPEITRVADDAVDTGSDQGVPRPDRHQATEAIAHHKNRHTAEATS